jgi:hypothetical protein
MFRATLTITTIGLLSTALLGCGGGGGSSGSVAGSTTGTLNLGVTDAPVDDAEHVLVQFTGVAVKPAGGDAVDFSLSGDSQSCRDLLDGVDPQPTPAGANTVRCVDLLAFQGSRSALLLQGEELDAGDYTWMRLDVDAERGELDSIIVLEDGREESLFIPSGSQSGLKLNSPFTVVGGEEHHFVIDFDLRKSLNNPQGFPDYRLNPSLRLVDAGDAGAITGTVAASLLTGDCTADDYAVYIYQGDNATVGELGSADPPDTSAPVTLDQDSGQWTYLAGFLPPGDYTAAFTCQAGADSPEAPGDGIEFVASPDSPATVIAGEESVVDFGPAP